MKQIAAGVLAFALQSQQVQARDLIMGFPVDCTLGQSCFLLNLPDADPGHGAADYTCGPRSYDGHKGTDFALPSYRAMARGVSILAVAPGRVRHLHDGVEDKLFDPNHPESVVGEECGNGVIIDHGGGWETQYCHMKQGSVAVFEGQAIRMGQVLGKIGLSGKTEYPHLHISVRSDGQVVDPFVPDGIVLCGEDPDPDAQLWQTPLPYPEGGIVSLGIAPDLPSFESVQMDHHSPDLLTSSEALVGWAMVHGVRTGDLLTLNLTGPNDFERREIITFKRTQVLAYRAVGRKAATDWPPGDYTLQITFKRKGRLLAQRESSVEIAPPSAQ